MYYSLDDFMNYNSLKLLWIICVCGLVLFGTHLLFTSKPLKHNTKKGKK